MRTAEDRLAVTDAYTDSSLLQTRENMRTWTERREAYHSSHQNMREEKNSRKLTVPLRDQGNSQARDTASDVRRGAKRLRA